MTGAADKPRRGWQEHAGDGMRRDHRLSCPRSRDKRRHGRCGCPWSWWRPQVPGKPRARSAPFYGTWGEARDAKRRQQVVAVEARVAWREQRAQLPVEGDLSVFEYFTRWIRQSERKLAPGTIYDRTTCYRNNLHATFGAVRVSDITAQMVEDWLNTGLDAGVKYWPMRSAFHTLQAMLGEAARKRHVDWNACAAIDFPAIPERKRRDYLTLEEYVQLVDACETPQERLFIGLAGEAALRRGEICGLKAGAVNFDAKNGPELQVSVNIVHVKRQGLVERPPKGGKDRAVALSPTLAALLREHIATNNIAPGDYLFASPSDGGALKPDTLTTWVRNVIERAGFVDDKLKAVFHLHDLRRTAATIARELGVPVDIIRDQLGHARDHMTLTHYIRTPNNPRLAQFAASIESIFDAPPDGPEDDALAG